VRVLIRSIRGQLIDLESANEILFCCCLFVSWQMVAATTVLNVDVSARWFNFSKGTLMIWVGAREGEGTRGRPIFLN
jgi:hypothetical protein